MAKTEKLLERLEVLRQETGTPRTIFAVCPNSMSVIRAAFRAAKRNHAPIYFAATLNQIDGDGGYTGMNQSQFTKMLQFEADRVNYNGCFIRYRSTASWFLQGSRSQEKPRQPIRIWQHLTCS